MAVCEVLLSAKSQDQCWIFELSSFVFYYWCVPHVIVSDIMKSVILSCFTSFLFYPFYPLSSSFSCPQAIRCCRLLRLIDLALLWSSVQTSSVIAFLCMSWWRGAFTSYLLSLNLVHLFSQTYHLVFASLLSCSSGIGGTKLKCLFSCISSWTIDISKYIYLHILWKTDEDFSIYSII